MLKRTSEFLILVLVMSGLSAPLASARSQFAPEVRKVDLVIALDVSSSMSGLIGSAKQRLWDVVNEIGRAQPQPRLRVAVISYGSPRYGAKNGFVRVDQPFTTDLDAVNETLFSFRTNGGSEFVARAVDTSIRKLQWSNEANALRMIFVAGNEAANQDPLISIARVTGAAQARDIVVNTIYCGTDNDAIAAGWQEVAQRANGVYASIDQNAAAVANIATPMDIPLSKLNTELNATYLAYGAKGERARENQKRQDTQTSSLSGSALASRAVAKAGAMYDSTEWDLVDALEAGKQLKELEPKSLPAPMRKMAPSEQKIFVAEHAARRKAIKAKISKLAKDRREFIAKKRAESEPVQRKGFDEAVLAGIRKIAERKGFKFPTS